MKEKLVAIKYDELGKCEQVAIVKNVQDKDYKALKNEENQHKEFELNKEQKLNDRLCVLEKGEHNHTFLIAKNIYDNFVDRGLLEDDQEFQQMFFEHIMLGKELEIQKFPADFSKILDYVRGI